MITTRDVECIEFVKKFKVASTSTLVKAIYKTPQVARRRLRELVKEGELQRMQSHLYSELIFYIALPKQFLHAMILSDFMGKIYDQFDVRNAESEYTLGKLRADGYVAYNLNGKIKRSFIEVQLDGKPNLEKYVTLKESGAWRERLDEFPTIVVICDANFHDEGLQIERFGLDLKYKG